MWTAHKLYFLCSYLAQVVRGMHGHKAFPGGLTFIDCFAGCGVCVSKDADGKLHRLPGSSLIASSIRFEDSVTKRFGRIVAVERNLEHAEALRRRIANAAFNGEFHLIEGDFNRDVDRILQCVPPNALSVAFVDPYSLDAHFVAIEALARARPVDLIVLFSDRIDLQRNLKDVYYPDPISKLDAWLGPESKWRLEYDKLSDRSGTKLRELFGQLYLRELRKIGYEHGTHWTLDGPHGPMFRLVFASKNALGLKYCEIARKEDFGGEVGLYG